jgi:hypothetical protein
VDYSDDKVLVQEFDKPRLSRCPNFPYPSRFWLNTTSSKCFYHLHHSWASTYQATAKKKSHYGAKSLGDTRNRTGIGTGTVSHTIDLFQTRCEAFTPQRHVLPLHHVTVSKFEPNSKYFELSYNYKQQKFGAWNAMTVGDARGRW